MQNYMIGKPDEAAYHNAFDASRQKFRALSPETIAHNTGCAYNAKTSEFTLRCFGEHLRISYPQGDVFFENGVDKPELSWRLIVLNYFSKALHLPLSSQWISYKDQPQGSVFYPSIRKHTIEPMGLFYDSCRKEILCNALSHLAFEIIPSRADLCAHGFFAPRIPVKILFWAGDEDFPGAFQLLFDKTLSKQMHIEDSVALCSLVQTLICEEYRLSMGISH